MVVLLWLLIFAMGLFFAEFFGGRGGFEAGVAICASVLKKPLTAELDEKSGIISTQVGSFVTLSVTLLGRLQRIIVLEK